MPSSLLQRIERYLRDPASGRFDELARDAFAFQVEHIPAVAALAAARGTDPAAVASWREVPAVPALGFKSVDLSPRGLGDEDEDEHGGLEVFRSSGTTGRARSVHRHPFPGLYRAVIDASFPRSCWGDPLPRAGAPMLSLIPPRADLPDSSLSFMVDHAMRRWGAEDASGYAFGAGGLDGEAAQRWLAERARDGRPGLVLATAFALAAWLDALAATGARHRLPAGTVLFETGGFKGRTRELGRGELLERVEDRLGIPRERVVREYGMTELTSQLYTDVLAGGDPDLFVAPHWVRVRVLDPETLAEARPGAAGLVAVFDLANLSSTVHLLTEDLGALEPGGLRLLGRAAGAELRGCSLAAEELIVGGRGGP
jgi:hypothetical protein